MIYRNLPNTDINISAIGLGTWAIGGGDWWSGGDDDLSQKAILTAIDNGINLIDTAPCYGFGHSEEIVGNAIAHRKREDVIISTKCGLWWEDKRGAYSFTTSGKDVYRCLQPQTIIKEVENSLRRLNTDYIDILHTHWQEEHPGHTPISETMECLMSLVKAGKIRYVAVSNANCTQMEEYRAIGPIVANQAKYSMLDSKIEKSLVPYCTKHKIAIFAYSPLEQGLLTGKIGMDREFAPGEARNHVHWFKKDKRQSVLNMLHGWDVLCEKYSCTTGQLVTAWTIAQKGITCALIGARKPHHIIEAKGACDITLDKEDIDFMRQSVEKMKDSIDFSNHKRQ